MSMSEYLQELKDAEAEGIADLQSTINSKAMLANQIKQGLGKEIKNNPNGVRVIKKSWFRLRLDSLKSFFRKF